MRASRDGAVSVAELLLVFWLYGFVLLALAGLARGHNRLAIAQEGAVRRLELLRTAAVVLGAELRYLAAADVLDGAPDSLRLRAVRGGGSICGVSGDVLHVRYRGLRLPESEKDSALLLLGGREVVAAVEEVGGRGPCGEVSLRVRLPTGEAHPTGGLALVFETGTYLIGAGALRYRRGAGGRQPLSESILRSGGLVWDAAGIRVELALHPDSLRMAPPEPLIVRVPLLNLLP